MQLEIVEAELEVILVAAVVTFYKLKPMPVIVLAGKFFECSLLFGLGIHREAFSFFKEKKEDRFLLISLKIQSE